MTGENKTFKKLPSLGTLNIPSPEDIPHSPGYKRQGFLFFEFYVIKNFVRRTPRLLSIDVTNTNEDLKNGIEKIEGTLTNSKPKTKVGLFTNDISFSAD